MPKRESFVDRNFHRVPRNPRRFRCRACGGSCAHSTAYKVHRQWFEAADHQVPQLAQVQPQEHNQLDVDAVLRGHPRCEHGSRISSLHAAAHLLQPIAVTSRGL